MPLASKAYRANTPEVRVLKAKLAHAISSNRLCPNRKHLIARQPYAPEYPWDGEMKGPFVHVVFNFQSWEMFEYSHLLPEVAGVPAIDAGENIKLYVIDSIGRKVMNTLRHQNENALYEAEFQLTEAQIETFRPCLQEVQTPAFYSIQLLVADKVLGQDVCALDMMKRVVQSEMVLGFGENVRG